MKRRLVLLAGVLCCASAVAGPASAHPDVERGAAPPGAVAERDRHRPVHSSDGVVGPVAPLLPAARSGILSTHELEESEVSPGVHYSSWERVDLRGPVRISLLRVQWTHPQVALDYAARRGVARTMTVPAMLDAAAVAGINGDFFDIGDTGAPLGLGRDRERGLLHARRDGWSSAFYLGSRGVPRIGTLPMRARIVQRPRWAVTNLNSPSVADDGIGVYTRAWGRTSGRRIVDGQATGVRMVLVRRGRVVAKRRTLPTGTLIEGTMLVGRGLGARRLGTLRMGSRVTVARQLAEAPRVAISGNRFLVRDGAVAVVDDREMHPRTAVGIDRDTGEVLMVVVDGRQDTSRGHTMVELAGLMVELGAEDALNLDGGGSSTMVTREATGALLVRNSPSDGTPRAVANGLQVLRVP